MPLSNQSMKEPDKTALPPAVEAAKDVQDAAAKATEAAAEVSPRAEHAAERVEAAAEAAVEALGETAQALKSKSSTRLCPTCKGELEPYRGDNPHKQGTSFCHACGTRWAAGLRHPA